MSRILTKIRGALTAIIYHSMLRLRVETGNSATAVSLMSSDIDRIYLALRWVLALVPNLVHIILAMWILFTQLGAVVISPVVIALGESRCVEDK